MTISNGFGVTLTFSITPTEVTPWLSVEPVSGIVDTNSSAQVLATLNATGLLADVYTEILVVESNDPYSSRIFIPVTMTVQEEFTPGLLLGGYVTREGGSGLAGVSIYRSYSTYPGELVATTDPDGFYQSDFATIPGDEIVTVWAELEGYAFEPLNYHWQHYYGYEVRSLDFLATPVWKVYLPMITKVE